MFFIIIFTLYSIMQVIIHFAINNTLHSFLSSVKHFGQFCRHQHNSDNVWIIIFNAFYNCACVNEFACLLIN